MYVNIFILNLLDQLNDIIKTPKITFRVQKY